MNIYWKNEGWEGKTGLGGPGKGRALERGKEGEYGGCALYTCMKIEL
jgi:hypothetical protein